VGQLGDQSRQCHSEGAQGRTATAQLPTPKRPTLRTRSRHLRRQRPSPKRSLPAGVWTALPSGRPSSESEPQRMYELKTCVVSAAPNAPTRATTSASERL
jgi:hypothetical protein